MNYTGRFAPSPTGLLHFGSLLAALASYLDARAHQGRWLLRIEDLDPPREHPEARHRIPATLERFGLLWDGDIVYQSDRHDAYRQVIEQLITDGYAYRCSCSRKQIQQRSGSTKYDGYCKAHPPAASELAAIRVTTASDLLTLDDPIQGRFEFDLASESGDYVIHRKDGLFSYQLAVVVDDQWQQISHVVRGCDLLEETPRQQWLQQLLEYNAIAYSHLPVANNAQGQKLSKQNLAEPLNDAAPVQQLFSALQFLGQQPNAALLKANKETLLAWAIEHWQLPQIPKQRAITWQD